jgi:hypothetical protein
MADGEREDQVSQSVDPAGADAAVSPSTDRVAALIAVLAAVALGFGVTSMPLC